MGFFDTFSNSGNSTDSRTMPWKILNSLEGLDEIIERSYEVPVAIFKHSTRCGISAGVLAGLEHNWDLSEEEVEIYYLDLIAFRPVSNAIAEKLQVWHQSPQLILIRDGKVLHHASHHSIQVGKVKAALVA